MPYVYPRAFDFKVVFDWIYLICFRILYLLSRLKFAIPTIINTFPFVSNGLFILVVFNCRTSR